MDSIWQGKLGEDKIGVIEVSDIQCGSLTKTIEGTKVVFKFNDVIIPSQSDALFILSYIIEMNNSYDAPIGCYIATDGENYCKLMRLGMCTYAPILSTYKRVMSKLEVSQVISGHLKSLNL